MNEFSPEQPQAARQFSSVGGTHDPLTDESGLSIEPTPAESRQSTMSTDATDRLANGEIGTEAPAGQHTYEQAGSHDCKLEVEPTGQGIAASLEARAGRTHISTESNFVQNMTTDSNPALTPSEEEVQKPASAPSVQPQSFNGCTPEVASGSPVSTLSTTPENKSEGVNLPAAAEGEPSAEAESGSSAATNSIHTKAMNANQTNPVSSGRAEEDAQGNSCEQTVQTSVEINACAASPGETEQIASPQAEPPSAVSSDSTNSDTAAIASANLNSGTDFVATTNTNTVMNTTSNTTATVQTDDASAVTIVNPADFIPADKVMILTSGAALPEPSVLGDKCAAYCVHSGLLQDITTEPNTKTLKYVASFSNNIPGFRSINMADSTPDTDNRYDLYVRITTPGTQYFAVEADDSGRLVIPSLGIDITKPSGRLGIAKASAHAPQAGFYRVSELSLFNSYYNGPNAIALKVSHDTVEIPDGNYSGANTYTRTFSTAPNIELYVLLKGAVPPKVPHTANPCGCASEGAGAASSGCATWDMSFGQFPMMAGMPSASVGFFSDKLAAADLSPANLRVNHPMLNELIVEGEKVTVKPQFGETVRYSLTTGMPLDNAALSTGRVRKLDADFAANTENEAAYIEEAFSDGSSLIYPIAGGTPVRMVTSKDVAFSADEFHTAYEVIRDDSGVIRQIYAASTGVLTVTSYGSSAFMLNLYPLSQVGSKGENGYYALSGSSVKSVAISGVADSVLNIIESTPDGMPTRYRWNKNGNVWTFTKGDESVNEQQTRTEDALSPAAWAGDNTYTDADGNTIAAEHTQYRHTNFGQVIDKTISGSGDEAKVTQYIYGEISGRNDYGRVVRVLHPNGSHTRYEYDAEGREVLNVSSTAISGFVEKGTRTTYTSGRYNENRPATVKTVLVNEAGNETVLATTSYAYEDTADVHRVTTTRTAAGSSHSMVSITERFGTSATLPYARGRIKFSQAENGVQTWHSYESTELHGAVVKHIAETRAEGIVVNGQSRRNVEFIASNGTVLRQEEQVLTSAGEWVLISSESYTYDHLMRELTRTRGNGRTSSKAWMCCGLASETDEDGVTTLYNYDAAKRLIGKERSATETTPTTVTVYNLDAAGRTIGTMTSIGDMITTTATEFDSQGRIVAQTDVLGRVSRTVYSADGLTTTEITPAGATFITTSNIDGSTARVYGTGQRELVYSYDLNGSNLRTTLRNAAGDIVSQSITNGFGQTIVQAKPNTLGGFIYTRNEYNAKGQITKSYQDTGWNTPQTAATLFEYDTMGNVSKKTLALAESPTTTNSPIEEYSYGAEALEDGIYSTVIKTRYNTAGDALTSEQKQMISALSSTIESKSVSINERNLTSTQWTVYNTGTKRTTYSNIPASTITAETVTVDGFVVSRKDNAGITSTEVRSYAASGMSIIYTDGRGNATITATDIAGRTILVTDAAGNSTRTTYCTCCDQPATVTDAQGNTSCYCYDERGRKIAEWGTGIQPVCYAYDSADRLISLTTFRVADETISSDPTGRTDGDTTTWGYHDASGMETSKTYADGKGVTKTYDTYNRLLSETDGRGVVKTHSYEQVRGILLGTTYSDGTTARAYSYNHLGQLTQVVDDAGTRTIGYNAYNEQESDSLLAGGKTHLVTELRDDYGRSSGYTYANNGSVQQTVSIGYDTDGRISSAGFVHGGAQKLFTYSYLPGTNLLQTLVKPNNMTLTQSYEEKRDLLIGQLYKRSSTSVASRSYTYDTLGRPMTRSTSKDGSTVNDSFGYNSRSELNTATVNNAAYAYDYDNIGNRDSAQEAAEAATSYESNQLNQYTTIGDFAPTYDDAGNQTKVKTSSGIWTVVYNAENRPISFTNADNGTIVECTYDYMGRRATKKVSVNGSVTLYQRFLYRGYLQIACCDLTRSNHPCLWLITWDPSQSVATRPLAIQKDGTWYTYGWDLTKNICEVYGQHGYIRTNYSYSPYGEATISGDVTQAMQWSSEFNDTELGLIYYNYRHYAPSVGRWLMRDSSTYNIANLYAFVSNKPHKMDYLGNDEIELEYHFINRESDINTWISENISDAAYNQRIERQSDFNPNAVCPVKDCISRLTINAHGNFYDKQGMAVVYLMTSDGEIHNLSETTNTELKGISNFINNANIRFCKNAVLDFNICYIGLNEEIARRIKEHYKDINLDIITHTRIVMPGGRENWILTGAVKIIKAISSLFYE